MIISKLKFFDLRKNALTFGCLRASSFLDKMFQNSLFSQTCFRISQNWCIWIREMHRIDKKNSTIEFTYIVRRESTIINAFSHLIYLHKKEHWLWCSDHFQSVLRRFWNFIFGIDRSHCALDGSSEKVKQGLITRKRRWNAKNRLGLSCLKNKRWFPGAQILNISKFR